MVDPTHSGGLDPLRRLHAVFGLKDCLRAFEHDPAMIEESSNALLRRMRVSWADLLDRTVNPNDPLPVRQADVMACHIYMLREHAEPGWLAKAAVWHRFGPEFPDVLEHLRIMLSEVVYREEVQLEALRLLAYPPLSSEPCCPVEFGSPTLLSSAMQGEV